MAAHTHGDLDTIDGQLGVTLPAEYRQLIQSPPPAFATSGFRDWVHDTPGPVVSDTRQYRLGGLGETPFPPDPVVIADTGTGDFFCLDLSQDPAPVVEFDHERGRFRTAAFSFTSWLNRLIRESAR